MGIRTNFGGAWDALRGRERANPVVGASYDRLNRQWGVGDAWAKPTYGDYYPGSVSVYAAIKLRQEAIASVPCYVYKQTAEGLEQVDPSHPLQRLLLRVNNWWTRGDLWRATETYLGLWGSAYWALSREGSEITEIWPLRPDKMKILPDAKDYIKGFVYGSGTDKVAFAPDEIIWFRYFNPLDEYSGLSPIAPVRLSVDMGMDALKGNRFALANDASPGMIISVADTPTDDEVMSFYDRWEYRFRGPEKSRRPAILAEGMTASNLGFSPKDMMALESMRWSVEDVARVYNVPMPMLHDLSRATYANIMTARHSFWEDCIIPQLHFYEEELTEMLVPLYQEEGLVVRFDTSAVPALQEDEDGKAARRNIYLGAGVMTVNEVRADMGLEATENVISYPTLAAITAGVLTINEVRVGMGLTPVEWGDKPPATAPGSAPPAMSMAEGAASTRASPVEEPEDEPPEDPDERGNSPTVDDDWKRRGRAVEVAQKVKSEQLENSFRRELSTLLRKQANQFIREFEAEAETLGRVGPIHTNGSVAVAERQGIFRPVMWLPEFTALIRKHLTIGVLTGAETQIQEHNLGLAFDMTASPITGWIENRSRWWANNINDGTEKKLFKVLADGRKAGLGTDEIAKNLREFREFQTVTRSERVARTEMTVAQGQGALESFDQAEIPWKRWFAAIDGRERDSHREASGQVRRRGELFEVGSDKMEAPGQGSQARENVNCRCVLLPEEEEPKEEPREEREEVGDIGGVTAEVPQAEPLTVSNWVPEINKTRGITESARQAASNSVAQVAQSLKPALGKKMMRMWADPERRMTVVANGSKTLRGIHPETGKPFQAGGIYRRGYKQLGHDKTWVGERSAAWAAHHEVGHQLMNTLDISRIVEFLGKARAEKFLSEVQKVFYKVEHEGRRAVSTYSKSNSREFLAENFKYAITAPEHLKLVDPEMLRIMQKYWVSKTPAKYVGVPGQGGPNPGNWAWIERLFNQVRWGEAYRAMREVM